MNAARVSAFDRLTGDHLCSILYASPEVSLLFLWRLPLPRSAAAPQRELEVNQTARITVECSWPWNADSQEHPQARVSCEAGLFCGTPIGTRSSLRTGISSVWRRLPPHVGAAARRSVQADGQEMSAIIPALGTSAFEEWLKNVAVQVDEVHLHYSPPDERAEFVGDRVLIRKASSAPLTYSADPQKESAILLWHHRVYKTFKRRSTTSLGVEEAGTLQKQTQTSKPTASGPPPP